MNHKVTFFTRCCISLLVLSNSVRAQSQVTLYGIIDEGGMYLNNTGDTAGGTRVFLDSLNGANGSRWGMKGTEDLGGGLRALFVLESGINLNNGTFAQGGTAFGRQAFVGLTSDRYGSLTLGRQYDMVTYFPQSVTSAGPLAGGTIFAHPADLDNTANSLRVNNAIRYMSPDLGGFTFGGEYSVGGVAGNVTARSGYSLGAGYSYGPLSLSAAFEYFKNPTSATAGSGFFTGNANGVSVLSQSLNRGYASASSYQVAVAGASYAIGPVTVAASFSNIQYGNLGGAFNGSTARFNNADFTARYFWTPSVIFSFAYDYLIGKAVSTAAGETVGNQHYHQVALVADYFLSKRTDVYLQGAYQRASGISSTGAAAVADIGNLGDSSNDHQIAVRVALRHKF